MDAAISMIYAVGPTFMKSTPGGAMKAKIKKCYQDDPVMNWCKVTNLELQNHTIGCVISTCADCVLNLPLIQARAMPH